MSGRVDFGRFEEELDMFLRSSLFDDFTLSFAGLKMRCDELDVHVFAFIRSLKKIQHLCRELPT